MVAATARDGAATVDGVALPLAGGTASGGIRIGLRPEHLTFSGAGLPGRVAQIEPMGREILYVVDTGVGHMRVLEHGSSAGSRRGRGSAHRILGRPFAGLRRGERAPARGRAGAPAGMTDGRVSPTASAPPIGVEGPDGPIRLKWHKLRTDLEQAPFKLSNLALGWKLGASLEVDIIAAADGRFVVLHDATLGPSTTGRGRVASKAPDGDDRPLSPRRKRVLPMPTLPSSRWPS